MRKAEIFDRKYLKHKKATTVNHQLTLKMIN